MIQNSPYRIHPLQKITERGMQYYQLIRGIEAIGGAILLLFAAIALVWANSQYADSYAAFLHTQIAFSLGSIEIKTDLHFIINDVLMTLFFLAVGVEVRKEIHDGTLADLKSACLPVIAACGGVIVPALIYLSISLSAGQAHQGWAIPTATDIAFAVGILALLGKRIPASARIFLLTLAIIDDIIAVLIIALFYSSGLNATGAIFVVMGLLLVFIMQRMGIFSMLPYAVPACLIWYGLYITGVHPSLAGVILGLLTPVAVRPSGQHGFNGIKAAYEQIKKQQDCVESSKKLQLANRELHSPVNRVSYAFSPWIAFLIMPLFALANAGVNLTQINFDYTGVYSVITGISIALILGKPLGIFLITWLCVRIGIAQFPATFNYRWLLLVSCLAGIGFTMSIFTATLAFQLDPILMDASKLGVLIGSIISALLGLAIGIYFLKTEPRKI